MILKTGDRFVAETKVGGKATYEFVGLDADSKTGCDYIVLMNLDDGSKTCVEATWFRTDICGRKITPLREGRCAP